MRQKGRACRSHAAIALSDRAQSGIVGIFVLILVLVIAVAGGAYYLGRVSTKLQPTKTQQPAQVTPSPDPTANWKVYTSNFGFSFKYPEGWEVRNLLARTELGDPLNSTFIGKYAILYLDIEPKNTEGGLVNTIVIVAHSLEEVVESYKRSVSFLMIISENKITLSGYPGVELITENPQIEDPQLRTRERGKTLLVYKDEKTFIVNLSNSLLSTFKFTPQ